MLPAIRQLTCCLFGIAAGAQQIAPSPTFAGSGVDEWARRLVAEREPTSCLLANGQPASLDVLRALLAQRDEAVVGGAALACAAIGPAAVSLTPRLLDRLRSTADENTQSSCTNALVAIGWQAVPQLERAGYPELARQALRTGPLRHVTYLGNHDLEFADEVPAAAQLPTITWASASDTVGQLLWFRAAEGPNGLQVDAIHYSGPWLSRRNPPEVRTLTTTIPRDLALALTRQLVLLRGMKVTLRSPYSRVDTFSDDLSQVRLCLGEQVVLDESFVGRSEVTNVPRRFRAEAAVGLLGEALRGARWTAREPSAADREQVASLRLPADCWWAADRQHEAARLLGGK